MVSDFLRERAASDRFAAAVLAVALLLVVATASGVGAQTPSARTSAPAATQPSAPAPEWTFAIRDTFRLETWRFFDPNPGGGDPDYGFAFNRLLLQAQMTSPRFDLTFAAQHVGLINLPDDAVGPGALGTGPIYYGQGGRRENPQKLYLRYANVRFKAPSFTVQAGRMAYHTGAEAPTGVGKIEAVKRTRLNARLVGEFEWSAYQRGFDGVRADLIQSAWRVTGFAFMPTQGGFAREAGTTMTDVLVAGATVSSVPTSALPGTQLQGFLVYYDDTRAVTGRPDNSGLQAPRADVSVTAFGGNLIGAYPVGEAQADVLLWAAGQTGNWYGDDHSAVSLALETGFQWTSAPWAPWLRGGLSYASGDDNASDAKHGTFFPMLPTMRRFSATTAYSTMNLRDLFVQAILRPSPDLGLRVDLHGLALASSADRWYAGSGATLERGGNFGYVSRPSHGETGLGTSVEFSATYTIDPRWSVNGFLGRINGGDVVTGSFQGDGLWFFYVESGVRLDWPWQ
jgi:hypothetical protein